MGTFLWDTLYVRVQANIHTDTDPACVWDRVRPCQAQKTDISRLSIPQPGQPQARHRPSQAVTGPETRLGIISHPLSVRNNTINASNNFINRPPSLCLLRIMTCLL